jgi:phosphate acetyltransferase
MSFIENVKNRARENKKTIVLPEATDIRVLTAANRITEEGFAKVILIGNTEEVNKIANDNGINLAGVDIVEPEKSAEYEEYVKLFYELRKEKGVTEEMAKELIKDPVFYGMMMLKSNKADGLVSRSYPFDIRYIKAGIANIKNSTWN